VWKVYLTKWEVGREGGREGWKEGKRKEERGRETKQPSKHYTTSKAHDIGPGTPSGTSHVHIR